jgi:hypothetical protein
LCILLFLRRNSLSGNHGYTQTATKIDILSALGKAPANADEAKMAQYDADKEQIQKKAEELEKGAQSHLHTHQALAASVTMFQIAIAVGAIAVLITAELSGLEVLWSGQLVSYFSFNRFSWLAITSASSHKTRCISVLSPK